MGNMPETDTVSRFGPRATDGMFSSIASLPLVSIDGLAVKHGIELNRVPIAGGGDRTAEFVRPAVGCAGDDEWLYFNTAGARRHRGAEQAKTSFRPAAAGQSAGGATGAPLSPS